MARAKSGWVKCIDGYPPAGKLVLGLWMPPHASGSAWAVAKWDVGKMQWLVNTRSSPDLAVPVGQIAWWHELPAPPEGVEIASG